MSERHRGDDLKTLAVASAKSVTDVLLPSDGPTQPAMLPCITLTTNLSSAK